MPDLSQMPGQTPKVYGTPTGLQAPTGATDRNTPSTPTDEQVKLAYQAYMRQVIAAAHQHFDAHLQAQQPKPAAPAAAPGTTPAPPPGQLGAGMAQQGADLVSGRGQQIDKAVTDAGG